MENKIDALNKLNDENNRWIVELPSKKDIISNKKPLNIVFKPLWVKEYSNELLDYGKTRLFMTGTLGSYNDFCKWNGIDPSTAYYINEPSPFPVKNRPIFKSYVGSMKMRFYLGNHLSLKD